MVRPLGYDQGACGHWKNRCSPASQCDHSECWREEEVAARVVACGASEVGTVWAREVRPCFLCLSLLPFFFFPHPFRLRFSNDPSLPFPPQP